ncbi:hypothetical protein SPRG_20775 [Saprolegnia parasitica CBS 223.65]|uniref:EF-hand domain-containing protein n=1 Tax=Saprolegnia parasitica (strain CBS 223.65) TaxID=695850 RepID=A0A067CFA4_SAPPC|nr:hypothetical protein SPRG_20775 [Saprolegnia parasitica CBS 223.65]KDO25191.1 hypothetical protein SPRG_20775 [Saprolegnia parasitica CBS 223.65]|eukprot:XP_012204104.1 hypothetical protein SPRG_20775 [Saprolegnia parasitica CBS 223.65]
MTADDEDGTAERLKRPITDAHPTLYIETRKAHAAASVDLYCLLFNAQGELVDHVPVNGSLRDGSIVQAPRNQHGYHQKMVISLAKVHLGVDVIGIILSHGHDVVFDPHKVLDDCVIHCSLLSSDISDAFVDFSATGSDVVCVGTHSASASSPILVQNAFVVAKIYRNNHQRHTWLLDPINEAVQCSSHCIVGLTRAMQLFLLDIIPDIDIPNVTSLKTIRGICSTLTRIEFLELEELFRKNGKGLPKSAFAECLAFGIIKYRPELRTEKRATALLRLLCEMFDQIDINGDEKVDWEEFTTFCAALGMLSTKQSHDSSDVSGVEYIFKQIRTAHTTRPFPYHITKMRAFEHVRKVAILEQESPLIAIFEMDGTFLHDITNVMKTSVMKDGLYILDIEHIPTRNCYVISSSDRILTLWNIVNAVKGQYVQSGRFTNHHMVRTVKWCATLKLCMTSSSKHTVLWNFDAGKIQHRLHGHSDLITDIVEVPGAPLFLTASYDHTVALWEMDRMRIVYTFEGHTQGVLHVDCIGNVLVSCGFEHHARVWSLATRKQLVLLTGHHEMLLDAKLVRFNLNTLLCTTGDVGGNFKVWDISRCIVDASKDAAVVLHVFSVGIPGCVSPVFHSFTVLPHDHKQEPRNELCEIWTGTVDVVRIVPEAVSSTQAPMQHVLYNALAHTFTASVGGKITVWRGKDGHIEQEPIHVASVEVCGLCYDLPRQRKLFVSTSDGSIHMYNLITGEPMSEIKVHNGDVLAMIYCEHTNCLITAGGDDTLAISSDVKGEGRLDTLRTIGNVHRAGMTACAYSSEHGLIVTGDVKGHIRVHDFQRLSLTFRCEGHGGEITALAFHPATCVLFAADATGDVCVWQLLNVLALSQCVMRLVVPVSTTFLTTSDPSTPIVTTLCATADQIVAGDDHGRLHVWPIQLMRKQAKGITKLFFEPLPANMIAFARGGYNPNLRMKRTQSVATSDANSGGHHHTAHHKPIMGRPAVVQIKAPTTWVAHTSKICHIAPLPSPGFVFSADDTGVRLWSVDGDCLGVLDRKRSSGVETGSSEASIPWKYRLSPTSSALELSAAVQAMSKNVLRKVASLSANAATVTSNNPPTHRSSILLDGLHLRTQSYRRCSSLLDLRPKSRKVSIVEKEDDPALAHVIQNATAETAFSRRSLAEGIKTNTFTQDEGFILECLSHDDHARKTYDSIVFPPLLLTKAELRRQLEMNAVPKLDADAVDELPMLRTCDNFLGEVRVHKAKMTRFSHEMPLDPSPFLQTHLTAKKKAHATTPLSVPKTQKATSLPQRMQWKLDGFLDQPVLPSVVKAPASPARRNARQWTDPAVAALDARLESSLGQRQTQSTTDLSHVQANISRKLTLCETLQGMGERRTKAVVPATTPTSRRVATPASERTPVMDIVKAGGNPFGPRYSPKDVLEFGDTLQRFDKDLSGDIDIDEWLKIMTALGTKNHAIDVAVARDLFSTVDENDDGLISHQELLHIVFLQATKEQLMLMEELIRASQHRHQKTVSPPLTSHDE